ncbi:MAG: bifunctional alpha,alpha-trehalose-phosphate synthase (UDP-forming)/trehalose-phosphatase [Bacteroidales bacterium]|jgi:trehalose 6-phosphate synthase/phosphatase|nr:bifunctional alpha,alpha-trehalose-phosphate synthase (UDP-forming)/trehalose-phosphatase [Bacteroidales bacterium]
MNIFIISNRLPIKISKDEDNDLHFEKSGGGLATGLSSLELPDKIEKHWIGWPGMEIKDVKKKKEICEKLGKMNYHPVFLTEKQIKLYYEGYCNSILWPLFHYFYSFVEYENNYWETYKAVNKIFCQEACKIIKPGDIVWVQDYHLMLLPAMLRKAIPDIKIAYFHHVPFPSYELFRVLPESSEILKGLLGADLIGFHTYDYTRHFVSAVYRVLKLTFNIDCVSYEGHDTYVDSFPMGINYKLYHDSAQKTEIKKKVRKLKSNYGFNNKLILSVDRLDYSKGIIHRIKGFKMFLSNHPEYIGKVSLVMIVVPSRDTVKKYARLKRTIDEQIGAINGTYSTINWTPVYYFYHSFEFDNLIAMYSLADIALVAPLRDGMNLVSKEYIAAKGDNPGVLILSEMAGSAIELQDAIIINPNDIRQIENAIVQAVIMPEDEQKRRIRNMQAILSKQTVEKWASDFIKKLIEICDKNKITDNREISAQISLKIQKAYKVADKRLLVFDYDGTLVGFSNNPEEASPDKELINILKDLISDKKNHVVITSGRNRSTLEEWFGNLDIGLAAEHGAAYKENGKWNDLTAGIDWDKEIVDILNEFTDGTPGARLEVKRTALVWHFRNVDEWLAGIREQQLINALIPPCNRHGLQLMRGNKILEIKSPLYSKGIEMQRLMKNYPSDFIMAIGDDTTDEDMFNVMPRDTFSIKVGGHSDNAGFRIKSQTEVRPFIKKISGNNK